MTKPMTPHGALGERRAASRLEPVDHRRHHLDKDSSPDHVHKTSATQVQTPKTERPLQLKPSKKKALAKSGSIHSSL